MIAFVLLLLLVSTSAEAVQVGRITSEVNFRKGPSLSETVINRLRAGEEVDVLKLDPTAGWYFVIYRGRPGYVYKTYIVLEQQRDSSRRSEPTRNNLRRPAGVILAGIGIVLMASVLAPDFLVTATVLGGALVSVAVLDLWFQLGILYSMFFVSCGAFALFLFFKHQKKIRASSADESSKKKAA